MLRGAPKHLYSAKVVNHATQPVHVKIVYDSHTGKTIEEQSVIAPEASHKFEQKTFTEGSCTYTYEVGSISVQLAGSEDSTKISKPFEGINSPTKEKTFDIRSGASGLEVVIEN